ncbi:MAG: amino acid ABC transporter permease [Lachnospiraceae bacterium]
MIFDFEFAVESFPQILSALPMTLLLTAVGVVISIVFGFLLTICRINKVPVLGKLASLYLLIIRGVPLMVQLYFSFVAFPLMMQAAADALKIDTVVSVSPVLIAIAALACNYAAYMSEVIRSALMAVDKGQTEAALAIGMNHVQAMRRIIIPQAVALAIPSLGNTVIGMVKDTSLAYMVMVMELMGMAKKVAGSGLNYLETYVIAALIYWAVNIILEQLFRVWEKKASHFTSRTVVSVKREEAGG